VDLSKKRLRSKIHLPIMARMTIVDLAKSTGMTMRKLVFPKKLEREKSYRDINRELTFHTRSSLHSMFLRLKSCPAEEKER
jgi:hypothetical protein